ncbi:hypothetical protein KP509_36G015100 [Ceratopteris richardii]|uniref:TLDc domain-containing protein n=1 Tax=Ceratopteris richardii TaxID=49495 RepID=A0A8T2QAW1_CERRI|nr:hypothetical protein KP509_36G015100 [Ceratopteris richardii]KAH7280806.1 hypothetical protein KP509_36G015100 [Ceratopteris richardii]
MGVTSSRQDDAQASEIRSLESRLSSLEDLPALRALFSRLTNSSNLIPLDVLKENFKLEVGDLQCSPDSQLDILRQNVGFGIVDTIFHTEENGVSWKFFLKGIEKCHQPSISMKLCLLFSFFYNLRKRAELPLSFSFESEDFNLLPQAGLTGHITYLELQDFIWLCWLMEYVTRPKESNSSLHLPSVDSIIKSAQMACTDNSVDKSKFPVEKLQKWMLRAIPRLPFSLFNFIQSRVCQIPVSTQPNLQTSEGSIKNQLLGPSIAWAVGLSLLDTLGAKILSCSFSWNPDVTSLLYRSAIHGKGMNRFWVQMEGYNGAVLILIQGYTLNTSENNVSTDSAEEKWLLGAIVSDGFVNKNGFYGDRNCCIFSLQPVTHPFRPSGRGSNFVYSHSHVGTSASYLQQQRGPQGIAFGGSIGKERVFLDEDFMHIFIRHHAIDKTYEPGQLLPDQGYQVIKGKVTEVEAWGFGGAETREKQAQYQNRKDLFVEQKRKVDLQSFGNWADSPEKMMLDMVSDPNKVQREER